jgi:hypothetical protein
MSDRTVSRKTVNPLFNPKRPAPSPNHDETDL